MKHLLMILHENSYVFEELVMVFYDLGNATKIMQNTVRCLHDPDKSSIIFENDDENVNITARSIASTSIELHSCYFFSKYSLIRIKR